MPTHTHVQAHAEGVMRQSGEAWVLDQAARPMWASRQRCLTRAASPKGRVNPACPVYNPGHVGAG